MKFAKELDQELVPEWHAKYLDYKAGKKHVRAVGRAVARANGSPRVAAIVRRGTNWGTAANNSQNASRLDRTYDRNGDAEPTEPFRRSPAPLGGADSHHDSSESSGDQKAKVTTPMLMPGRRGSNKMSKDDLQYGSFVPTPPAKLVHHLELPDPALTTEPGHAHSSQSENSSGSRSKPKTEPDTPRPLRRDSSLSTSGSAYEIGRTAPSHRSTFNSLSGRRIQPPARHATTPVGNWSANPRDLMRRVLSHSRLSPAISPDVSLPAFDQVRARQKDFFQWMDNEFDKVETFYKEKEDEAGERLKVLREQLHEMRNRRIEEIAEARRARDIRKEDEHAALDVLGRKETDRQENGQKGLGAREQLQAWIQPIEKAIENAKNRTRAGRPGANSKALVNMYPSPDMRPAESASRQHIDSGRDYTRKRHFENEVPYRAAKRKLKLAIKEYYRGLELLKSYALLNRTAFRKINKKYDKVVNPRPSMRYMSEKVNKAWFVQSSVLEDYIQTVEDLYSRYFERGNHKIAVGKLRSSLRKPGEYANSAFRSGIFIGTGAVFAIQGLLYAVDLLHYSSDSTLQTQTSYLLQIYGAYFLALYLFAWFCFNCRIWNRNKINYVFIFEFDSRNHLDWRELAEFPAFFLLLLGLFMWLNFSRYGSPEVFLYYPVILIFVTALVIFMPAPILLHRSRGWFVYSHWRLLLAGLYPVEFRDFLLGDMYCSLTYFMSSIALLFCLYAQHWIDPPQCNSTHSRVLGFLSTLPGIWRALQCIRRYWDTGNIFPHLVNCGKYSMTILYYMSLSLYRIQESSTLLAVFITFATINAVYCSVWDLAMDWSLCQPHANKRFLRDVRGYKSAWPYYAAMIIDPVMRFNWVFFIAYTHDLQHNSIASFLIAFSEVSRRGMWTLFRVENEHCANVQHFKASRDVPLPYDLPPQEADTFTNEHQHHDDQLESESTTTQALPQATRFRSRTFAAAPNAAEEGEAGPSGLRRRGLNRSMTLTQIFAQAHTQDFEKKRTTGAGDSNDVNNLSRGNSQNDGVGFHGDSRSSDEDDDDDDGVEEALHALDADEERVARRNRHGRRTDEHAEGYEGSYSD